MNEIPAASRGRFSWILRLAVGGAFVVAGGLKIATPTTFVAALDNYRLLPHGLLNGVAVLLPGIEVAAGALVLAGVWLRAAALVIASLTVIFFAAILSALVRGLNIECGCFGTLGGTNIGLTNLAVDSALLFLAMILVGQSEEYPAHRLPRGRVTPALNPV